MYRNGRKSGNQFGRMYGYQFSTTKSTMNITNITNITNTKAITEVSTFLQQVSEGLIIPLS
jgi:hypothetical protein